MNTTLKVKITELCECEMSPALSDSYGDSNDPHYRALVPVAEAISNGRRVKGGTTITLTDPVAINALRDEAKFRAEACADQAQDAWDNAERMTYFGMKRSFESIVKKCDLALEGISAEELATATVERKPVERKPAEAVELRPGAYVEQTVVNGRTLFEGYWVTTSGRLNRCCDKRATFEQALADAEFFTEVK